MRRIVAFVCMVLFICSTACANLPQLDAGSKAPAFTLSDANGKSVSLSDYAGKTVVLEWTNPNCPFVKRHYQAGTMTGLAEKYAAQGVVWLTINTTYNVDSASLAEWAKSHGINHPVLDDSKGVVGRAYGAKTTPHMFIINGSGAIVYNGAIDDDPSGESTPVLNYVDQALGELTAGKTVSTAGSKPYGCSVKYG